MVQKGNKTDDSKFVEINHVVPNNPQQNEEKTQNVIENGQHDEPTKHIKMEVDEPKSLKVEIKQEEPTNIKEEPIYKEPAKPLMEKWFSLADKELQLQTQECPIFPLQFANYCNVQCKDVNTIQGNRWEIQNNLHLYNVPAVLEGKDEKVYTNESILTPSGLNETVIKQFLRKRLVSFKIFLFCKGDINIYLINRFLKTILKILRMSNKN